MHKLVIKTFKIIKDIAYFFKLLGVFYMMLMPLYWIENIISAQWSWLNPMKPSLDYILSISELITPATINMLDIQIEIKYASAIILIFMWILIFRFIYISLEVIQDKYEDMHVVHKKRTEDVFNKNLKSVVIKEEKRIKKYSVLIKTKLKKKFSHQELKVNIDDYNKRSNDFITEKTGKKYKMHQSGFLYEFDNFEQIDEVLDVLFKLMEKDFPVEFSINIQAGENIEQLSKIASFDIYDKVIFAADTLLRYKINKTHRYQTFNIGIFHFDEHSLELHEFKRID